MKRDKKEDLIEKIKEVEKKINENPSDKNLYYELFLLEKMLEQVELYRY